MRDVTERLVKRVVVDERGCWNWQGAKNSEGYGRARGRNSRIGYTHRIMYEETHGPVPRDLQIDHLCRNPGCCNPEHLEAVTPLVNTRRGCTSEKARALREQRTHCPSGHPLVAGNLYFDKKGYQSCKECRRLRNLIWAEKRRENK